LPSFISTITGNYKTSNYGNYILYVFTDNSSVVFNTGITFNILAVGGGGGGGCNQPGGGGGGGVVQQTVKTTSGNTVNINIGKGGYSTVNPNKAYPGQNTTVVFSTSTSNNITAFGGGEGGSYQYDAGNGGSGGGVGWTNTNKSGSGISGQGNNGGIGYYGGGGGAGGPGENCGPQGTHAGNGGPGIKSQLPGIVNSEYGKYYWGGGGGAGSAGNTNGPGGNGGLGGGGGGSVNGGTIGKGDTNGLNVATDGKSGMGMVGGNGGVNTGGGGGGSSQSGGTLGGNGGSGIVIIVVSTVSLPDSSWALPPPPPPPALTGILTTTNIIGTNVDIVGTSSDNFNVIAFTTPNNNKAYFTVLNSISVNIFMVGGGGNGGGRSGGGAGGVVQQTVTFQPGTYTVNVGNRGDNANLLGTDRTSWIKDSNNNIIYIARAGGDGNGFNPGSGRPGNGGSGGGAAWAGSQNANSPGIQVRTYKGSTIFSAGIGNTTDNNIANPGGKGLINTDIITNNQNIGDGGGGGAGTPGGDATLLQAIGGNDQDGFPIGPIKGGNGGDGILCTLSGIKNFTYNGKNWGQLYWAGGGGAGFTGYTYDRTTPFNYNNPTKSADGGKGGGGGGQGPWKVGISSGGTQTPTNCFSGYGDNTGLNPGGTYLFYGSNDAGLSGPTSDGGNHGGNGGNNTGGGGGGGYDSGGGGAGGSGIIIISFAKI